MKIRTGRLVSIAVRLTIGVMILIWLYKNSLSSMDRKTRTVTPAINPETLYMQLLQMDPVPRREENVAADISAQSPQSDIKDKEGSTNNPNCMMKSRRSLVRTVCGRPDIHNVTKAAAIKSAKIPLVLVNDEMKIFACRLGKCASASSKGYFFRMNPGQPYDKSFPGPQYLYSDLIKRGEWNISGFYFIKGLPLVKAIQNYREYKRVILVRHPLQRIVSGYFEVREAHDPDHAMKNLSHVVRDWILKGVYNFHWSKFLTMCYPCSVQYDVIAKIETLDKDIPYLNAQLGVDKHHHLGTVHSNKNFSGSNANPLVKYDPMLRELENNQPSLFGELLEKYKADIDVFGYGWKDHTSVCSNEGTNCC